MAEITAPSEHSRARSGPYKMKKKPSRVDLTAMVDVCFLLIMFFIFTTQLEELKAMDLYVPKDTLKDSTKSPESGTLTLLLGKEGSIHFYEGIFDAARTDQLKTTHASGIREYIIRKKRNTDPEKLMIIIKPTNEATYKQTVDILDEMTINDIKRYALTDISEIEATALAKR